MAKPTMDYAKAAEEVRSGPADLPQVTRVLAELLDTLVEDVKPTPADAVYTDPVYPSSDEHPETLTLPKSDA